MDRWLARVWPGIALDGRDADGGVLVEAADLFRPALAGIARALAAIPAIGRPAADLPFAGSPAPAGAPATANDPQATLSDVSAADWKDVFYVAALVLLLALLAFTLWKEMGPALRAGLR